MTNNTPTKITRKARLLGLLAVAVSAIALVPAGASAAPGKKVDTQAVLQGASLPFNGSFVIGTVVTQTNQKSCMVNRPVTLKKGDGTPVASTVASSTFQVQNLDHGAYFFVAKRIKVTNASGKKIVCEGATSNTIGI